MPAQPERALPYVLLSCAMSVDGCLDAPGPHRLVLSGPADLDRVDSERAASDAVMTGAGTIRRDDPWLRVRSAARRAARAALGRPEQPARVTVTATGDLDPAAHFFAATAVRPLVYCPAPVAARLSRKLGGCADVIDAGPPFRDGEQVSLTAVLADLTGRGVRRLIVEAGASLGRQFLSGGLVDELQLVVAPYFVGAPEAPRFAGPASYPHGPARPMRLAGVRRLDDVVLLRYLLDQPPHPLGGQPGRTATRGVGTGD